MITIIVDTQDEYEKMMDLAQNYICRQLPFSICDQYKYNNCDKCYKDNHIKCGIRVLPYTRVDKLNMDEL